MIQDIAPHKYDAAFQNALPRESDQILCCKDGMVLCRREGSKIAFPAAWEAAEADPTLCGRAVFFFRIDETNYFGLWGDEPDEFGSYRYMPREKLRQVRPLWQAYAGIVGFQIHKWYAQNRFCGRCGAEMIALDKERAVQCTACGRVSYPQICPSVIVGITDGDRILLTKYAPEHSSFRKYALVAGYVEVGESLEDTVRREVMEEVGLRVKDIRYYKSQPWPFSDSLLAGFFCRVDGDARIAMDRKELSAAEWFARGQIPAERSESAVSLTGEMIEAFRDGLAP